MIYRLPDLTNPNTAKRTTSPPNRAIPIPMTTPKSARSFPDLLTEELA